MYYYTTDIIPSFFCVIFEFMLSLCRLTGFVARTIKAKGCSLKLLVVKFPVSFQCVIP